MIELNLKPSEKTLRQFGLVALVMLNVIGFVLLYKMHISKSAVAVFCIAGVCIWLLSRIQAQLVWPIYAALVVVSFPIGWIISHLLMIVFYYGILTPLGLFFRLIGRDVLGRFRSSARDSYWVRCSRPNSINRYFNQF